MANDIDTTDKKNIFLRFIDFLLGRDSNGSTAELKFLNKQLQKGGYRYYNFNKDKLTVSFAEMIYDIYKAVAPLREFFLQKNDDEYYARMTLMYYLSETQRKELAFISVENITELAKKGAFTKLTEDVKRSLLDFEHGFNQDLVYSVNYSYNSILKLKQFCTFDFYALLRRFTPELRENSFDSMPKFYNATGRLCCEPIVDLFTSAETLLTVSDWSPILKIISQMPGYTEVSEKEFMRVIALVMVMGDAMVFTRLSKILKNDKDFDLKPVVYNKEIVRPFLENQRITVKETLASLFKQYKLGQIKEMEKRTFLDYQVLPLQNYNKKESVNYENYGVNGFLLCDSIMYLNAYFNAYLRIEVYEFMDIFCVRAQSSDRNFVSDFSMVYHDLLEEQKQIDVLDAQLDPKFPTGYKIASFLDKIKNDPDVSFQLNMEINTINTEMGNLLKSSLENILKIDNQFKELVSDKVSSTGLISNWEEIERYYSNPIVPSLNSIVEHLDNFITLMRMLK